MHYSYSSITRAVLGAAYNSALLSSEPAVFRTGLCVRRGKRQAKSREASSSGEPEALQRHGRLEFVLCVFFVCFSLLGNDYARMIWACRPNLAGRRGTHHISSHANVNCTVKTMLLFLYLDSVTTPSRVVPSCARQGSGGGDVVQVQGHTRHNHRVRRESNLNSQHDGSGATKPG